MYKGITLNQFIGELQKLAVEHGNDEISSIGSSSGKIVGMSSPFCFNFKGHDATEFVPAYQHDVDVQAQPAQGQEQNKYAADLHKKWMEGALRNVWARVGMSLLVTPEEEKAIFEGDYLEGKETVMQVIESGRASVDGETYVPQECIEEFDEAYGTNYQKRDEECAWTMDGEYVNSGGSAPGLDGLNLPSVEQVEELVGQLRKYSEEEYEQHNNYIAEDLADAADVLSKLASARVFLSAEMQEGKVVNEVLADANARQAENSFTYNDAIRASLQSGKAVDIFNSPKAQALREGSERLLGGLQRNNDGFVK